MNKKKTLGKQLAAIAGVLTIGLAGLAGPASATQGEEGTPPSNAAAGTTGTLNIHKHAGSTTNDPNNGTSQTISRPPLAGAKFTICKVDGVDLTTDAGWTAAASKTTTNSTCAAGTTQDKTTDGTGLASFSDLPIGLYLVKETAAPTGVTTPAQDFLVSIPYPSKSGTGDTATSTWLWDVHVYPKNTLDSTGSKTVADPNAHGLGSLVPWTITTRPVGSFDNGAPLTTYKIIDALNANLQYDSTTSLQYKVPGGTLTAVPTSWYTINPAAAATTPGGTVTVEFTPAGITELNKLQAGTVLQWDLKTKVVGVGDLENKSLENTGGDDVQTGSATTQWGPVKLIKHEAGNESKGLKGAKFKVYNSNASATCTGDLGSEISVNGATEFESNASGVVNIAGLYVGKDGTPGTRTYCVVETVAPAGYVIDTTPRAVVVKAEATASVEYKIANTPTSGPELPLTGAAGTLLMTIGGAALVLIGGGVAVVARKRNNA